MGKRYLALDGLRGVAAVIVVLFHVQWATHLSGMGFHARGYLAVDLFFMLSGFVIAAAYGGRITNRGQFGSFLQRRFFRVYPLHLFVLLLLLALEFARLFAEQHGVPLGRPAFTGKYTIGTFLTQLFFLQGSGLISRIGWNSPAWSIGSEFIMYILFAVLSVLGLLRNPRVWLAAGAAGFAVYLAIVLTRGGFATGIHQLAPVRCIAGFSIGLGIYRLREDGAFRWLDRIPNAALSALQLVSAGFLAYSMTAFHNSWIIVDIVMLALLLSLLQADRGGVAMILRSPPIQALGKWSYSIYLIHVVLLLHVKLVLQHMGLPSVRSERWGDVVQISPLMGDLLLIGVLCLVVAAASVTFRLVEEPARQFGRRPLRIWRWLRPLGNAAASETQIVATEESAPWSGERVT